MQSSSGISVIIPAYNEERFLSPTLSALRKAAEEFTDEFQRPCEIIVCDNMSTDRTCEVARAHGARVVHHSERNIAGVRNAGS
jgi:glycosyltransferase involved in cell wall biosynthesis